MARTQLTLDNAVAAELAGSEDAVLRELEGKVRCDVHLRGNVLTLDGDEGEVRDAAAVVEELVGLIERGHDLAPATIETVAGAIDAKQRPAEILEDVIWRHRSIRVAPRTVNQKRYVDSIRDHTARSSGSPRGRRPPRRPRAPRGTADRCRPQSRPARSLYKGYDEP